VYESFGSKSRLAALAPSTVLRRAIMARKRPGNIAGGDAPLLDTGSLRDSVKMEVEGYVGRVGTNDPRMAWHELGSAKYPPRPVFRNSLNNTIESIHLIRWRVVPRILGSMRF